MRLKSYYSSSVESAVTQARKELGPDAMLVSSQRTTGRYRQQGEYEVIFTLPEETAEPAAAIPAPASTPEAPKAAAPVKSPSTAQTSAALSQELSRLRQQMEEMQNSLQRIGSRKPTEQWRQNEAEKLYRHLVEQGLGESLSRRLIDNVEAKLAKKSSEPQPFLAHLNRQIDKQKPATERWHSTLRSELERLVPCEPVLGRKEGGPRIVMLVGSPGVGKTTMMVKLAVQYGLAERKPMHLLSLDTERVAAGEQLATYSAILGTSFQPLASGYSLHPALEEHRNKELILIDTPGLGLRETDLIADLASQVSSVPSLDVHLVLSATAKPQDMRHSIERFQPFQISKLLFTHLDETFTFGTALAEAAHSKLPISFLSCGQQVPDDVEEANGEKIASLLLDDADMLQEELSVAWAAS